jgi:hypothetical protein
VYTRAFPADTDTFCRIRDWEGSTDTVMDEVPGSTLSAAHVVPGGNCWPVAAGKTRKKLRRKCAPVFIVLVRIILLVTLLHNGTSPI